MDPVDDKFRMNLPTLVSLQGDYYAGKNVYVNSTFNYAFQFKNNEDKIHEVTNFSITPRWDWKWLGAYVPLSYNKYSKVRLGTSVRVGPLIVGMADILPLISKRDVYGVDFHLMLKVPHISFKKDKNPRTKSKFNANRERSKKPEKRKAGGASMPKKDVSPVEGSNQQPKAEKRKGKGHDSKLASRDQKSRKHIFPKINIFKKKRRHKANPEDRDHIIYFKL